MSLIKAPLAGEMMVHIVDLYCKECRKVTKHNMWFAKIDPDDGLILANCICQNRRTKKDVSDHSWAVTIYEWTCGTYQCLALTKETWLLLISGLSTGGSHKRRS